MVRGGQGGSESGIVQEQLPAGVVAQTLPAKAFQGNNKEGGKGKGSGRNSPLNVATPSRGGGRGGNESRNRGPASALEDLMRRKGVDEAWNSLEEMQAQGITTDKYTVSRMLMKTVGDGRTRLNNPRVYRAITLVERFIEMQPTDVDEVLFNALLDTCGRLKDLPRLETTVQRMRDLKVTPSPVTLGILVKTYGQAGDIQKVLNVWAEMDTQRVQANAVTYGCMIDACVKCGHLSTAVDIFSGMKEAGKHRNTILYTTLIKGYGLDKDLKSALDLFREMPGQGVPYNTITYNSIIDACVKGGDLTTAETLLREIADPSNTALEPDLITFSTLLKGYCHIGDLDKALQLAEAIKARGLRCDELVYNTLMDGCVKANDVTAGVGLFEEMIQQGMRPSTITHSILARLYQRAGYEEDANEAVAQLYAHHGIERPVGGDRSKGDGRGRRPQRSPGSSPQGTPVHSFGGHQRSDSSCGWSGAWSDAQSSCGYDAFCDPIASGQSTPHGSPMAAQQTGMFLPFAGLPAFPGMGGGSDTPHSLSGRAATPLSGAFHGSPVQSPCALPYGEQQHQMMGVPVAPGAMPNLPPFPFNQGPDASMQQMFMQQGSQMSQMHQQQQQHPMQAAPQGWASPMGSHVQHGDASFPMPGSPPDMVAGYANNGQHMGFAQPQAGAFFESMTPTGQQQQQQQQQVMVPMNGHGQNPFCL